MIDRYTNVTTAHLDAIYGADTYKLVAYDITAPNGRHRHPQYLMRCSVERMLSEGYKLRLQ